MFTQLFRTCLAPVLSAGCVATALFAATALAQDADTDTDRRGNGGGVRARATQRPVPSQELVDYLLSELVAARAQLNGVSRIIPHDGGGSGSAETAIPPGSIAGAYSRQGETRSLEDETIEPAGPAADVTGGFRLRGDVRPADDEAVDEPQQVAGSFRLRGDVRPAGDETVDEPQQVAGSFRLQGDVRGDATVDMLYELLLDPSVRRQLLAAANNPGALPAELHDAAFDKYVDLRLLGDAWARLDAARLVDVAMQLAEGERILLRPHRGVSAADTLKLAAKTAIDLGDSQTLERLQRIAQARNDQALAALLASGAKLASASRDGEVTNDEEVIIHAEGTGPAQYALLHACCRDLKRAKLAGDGKTLQVLEKVIPELPLVSAEHKQQLLKSAKQPTPEVDAKTAQLQKTLHLLASASRCSPSDPGCTDGVAGTGFNRLGGANRCDANDPTCGGRYLATDAALADLEAAHQLSPAQRSAVSSALEKLRAASRECDPQNTTGCFP